jgi:hypothetical protein
MPGLASLYASACLERERAVARRDVVDVQIQEVDVVVEVTLRITNSFAERPSRLGPGIRSATYAIWHAPIRFDREECAGVGSSANFEGLQSIRDEVPDRRSKYRDKGRQRRRQPIHRVLLSLQIGPEE